eukprot:gene3543-4406_t
MRRLARCTRQRFLGGQAEQGAGHVHRQEQRCQRRCTGVAVRGDGDAGTGSAQGFDRRRLFFPQCIEGTGQKHRNRACGGHGSGAVFVEIFKMIGRQCAIGCGKLGTAEIGQLFRMQLDRNAKSFRPVKHTRDLGRREGNTFAKAVDRIDQTFRMGGVETRQHNFADVIIRAAAIFRRHRMGSKIAGADAHGTQRAEAARHPQHFQLRLNVEAVAGFDFDGGNALRQQGVKPRQALRDQFIFRQTIGRFHRGNNAAASPGDFLIAGALEAHFKLARAVAAENQMGMAVDQCRRRQAAAEILHLDSFPVIRNSGANPGNTIPFNADSTRVDQTIGRTGILQRRDPQSGQNFPHQP